MSTTAVTELFHDFDILTPADFHRLEPGRKPMFVSRLFQALTGDYDAGLAELAKEPGLKLHFAGRAVRGRMVANLPSDAFLKKLAFYASRTLVTFPFRAVRAPEDLRGGAPERRHEPRPGDAPPLRGSPMLFGKITTRRTPYGGEVETTGKAYPVDPADFDDFLALLCRARLAIAAGVVSVLPVFPDTQHAFVRHRGALVRANFELPELAAQFSESSADGGRTLLAAEEHGVALYLPTVAELPFKRILELRAAEKPAYDGLQHHLERLIHRGDEIATERELLEYLHRTDAGIAELNRRYKHALKEMVVGELEAVALTAGPPLLGAVSGAGLGMLLAPAVLTVMKNALTDLVHRRPPWGEFVKPIREYRKEVRGFAEHEFYLPWKLFRTGKTWLAA